MDEQTFWQIVQRAHDASHGNMPRKCELLTAQIAQLSKEDAVEFRNIFDAMMYRAFHHPLWAAAYLIHRGCGDDTFSDFRSSLISRGQGAFETALSDPDTLADEPIDEDAWFFEGYQYAVTDGLRAHFPIVLRPRSWFALLMGGARRRIDTMPPRTAPPLREPTGERWSEDQLTELLPKLAKRFG